jgi:hypothetical protein
MPTTCTRSTSVAGAFTEGQIIVRFSAICVVLATLRPEAICWCSVGARDIEQRGLITRVVSLLSAMPARFHPERAEAINHRQKL